MKLGWIRHGETDWNVLGRIQGQTDIPLNANGRMQAEAIAARLSRKDWDWIATSDLQRALDTAKQIERTTGIPVHQVEPRLREKSFGQLEGLTVEQRRLWREQADAEAEASGAERTADEGVESDESVIQRAVSWLDETQSRCAGERILVVSHGGLLARVLPRLLPNWTEGPIGNTSLTIMERHAAGWLCMLTNCTIHLSTSANRSG